MWHQDAYNFYRSNFEKLIATSNQELFEPSFSKTPLSFESFCRIIRETPRAFLPSYHVFGANRYHTYTLGDCGYQYGKQWRAWETDTRYNDDGTFGLKKNTVDQIANVIKSIKSNPYSRRHLVSSIDPAHDTQLALYWCHAMFQFNCRLIPSRERVRLYRKNVMGITDTVTNPDQELGERVESHLDQKEFPKYYLDCHLYQRSGDAFLGVPLNIASYALLTTIIAEMCNMIPGDYIHTFGDVHIYNNHKSAVLKILQNSFNTYDLPTVKLTPDVIWRKLDVSNMSDLRFEDFILENYRSYPKIEAELSTGMKPQP